VMTRSQADDPKYKREKRANAADIQQVPHRQRETHEFNPNKSIIATWRKRIVPIHVMSAQIAHLFPLL
jgi:hypothetical protein